MKKLIILALCVMLAACSSTGEKGKSLGALENETETSSDVKKGGKKGEVDKFLDDYEEFANSYAKSYKKLYKKSVQGDMSVLIELQKLSAEATKFAERYGELDGKLNARQVERYNVITLKLTSAMSEAITEK